MISRQVSFPGFLGRFVSATHFDGSYADKIGFRKSMITAFTLLTIALGTGCVPNFPEASGLGNLTAAPHSLTVCRKAANAGLLCLCWSRWWLAVPSSSPSYRLPFAKETTEATRAPQLLHFYMMVNIGAFTGKTVIDPLRDQIGDQAWHLHQLLLPAPLTFIALLAVICFTNRPRQPAKAKHGRHRSRFSAHHHQLAIAHTDPS